MLQIARPELFSALLEQLERLQEILVAVATGTGKIQDLSDEYASLINTIEVKAELLQEEGVIESFPEPFEDLWAWYRYYSGNEHYEKRAQRGKFVYDYYASVSHQLEIETLKHAGVIVASSESLGYSEGANLKALLDSFENILKLLFDFSRAQNFADSIQEKEYIYKETRREILMCLSVGDAELLDLTISKIPQSLWQVYGLFQDSLKSYREREKYFNNLLKDERRKIEKCLLKASLVEDFSDSDSEPFSADKYRKVLSRAMSVQNSDQTKTSLDRAKELEASDFVILTAIEPERVALCKALNISNDNLIYKDHRTYWRTLLPLSNGQQYSLVIAQASEMANVNAALLAADALNHWQPQAVLMVGIAAATSRKQHLGDIVLGKNVYYYERGKSTSNGILPEPIMYHSDATLWNRVTSLLPVSNLEIYTDRPDGKDVYPDVYSGVIASGEQVIAYDAARDDIAKGHRKIKAIEMEGYGVHAAAHQRLDPIRCLVIRALCDYADGEKDDTWHKYAAAAVVSFTKYFLLKMPLEPRESSIQH